LQKKTSNTTRCLPRRGNKEKQSLFLGTDPRKRRIWCRPVVETNGGRRQVPVTCGGTREKLKNAAAGQGESQRGYNEFERVGPVWGSSFLS